MQQVIDAAKKFTGSKYFSHDFRETDLTNASFNHGTFVDCNFEGCDLSGATFIGANCYGSNFKDSIMDKTNFKDACLAKTVFDPKVIRGVTITLSCDSFDKMQVGRTALLYWLYIPLLMVSPDEKLTDALTNALGKERYIALTKVFKERP